MKRRSFLGALGAAVASGPKAVASAIPKGVTDLGLHGLGITSVGLGLGEEFGTSPVGGKLINHVDWAKQQLANMTGMTAYARRLRYRRHHVYSLDADTASLRSLSLSAKLARSKRIHFERQEENERSYLRGVIEGWIKD